MLLLLDLMVTRYQKNHFTNLQIAVQQAAKIALESNPNQAREKLHSVQRLMERSMKSQVQKEEYYNFISQSSELESQLKINNEKKMESGENDVKAKVLFKMKGASKNTFLSGARKTDAVEKRTHTDDKMTEMFYSYKFSEDDHLSK